MTLQMLCSTVVNVAVAVEADSFIHVKRKNSARVITSPVTPVLPGTDDGFKTPVRPGGKTTLGRKRCAVVSFTFGLSVDI